MGEVSMLLPVAFLLVVIAVIVFIEFRDRRKGLSNSPDYDERQKLVRLKGYRLGFIILMAEMLICGLVWKVANIDKVMDMGLLTMGIPLVSLFIVVMYWIVNDAYVVPGRPAIIDMIVLAVFAIMSWSSYIDDVTFGQLIVEGKLGPSALTLLMAVGETVLLIALIVKEIVKKRMRNNTHTGEQSGTPTI